MANTELLLPVGRLVGGSPYNPRTTDAEGKPLIIKTGQNAGQPRVDYYLGIAIPKATETTWQATGWGAIIVQAAQAGFPQGQWQQDAFSWKVIDGDSVQPNRRGIKPCDRTGYPGHWILNMSSAFAPQIYNADGSKPIAEPDAVKCGYYVQVFGSVAANGSQNQPGVFLNHTYIALSGYGEEIRTGADASQVGFGGGSLPPGATSTPPAGQPIAPPPPPRQPTMTALANGMSYEQFKQAGWTDEALISQGMMTA